MRRRTLLVCAHLVAFAVSCTSHRSLEPSAEQAAANYLAVHNDRDDEAARELWGTKLERREPMLEWFRAQLGSCSGFSPMSIKNDLDARFVFDCEYGRLEASFRVDETSGELEHWLMGARGVEPPAPVREMAEQLVALANGESATEPTIAAKLDPAEVREQLDVISAQGPCRIDRVHLSAVRGAHFVLQCATSSRTMWLDVDRAGALRRFGSREGALDIWREMD